MPTEVKPLFHPAAVRNAIKGFVLPPPAIAARAKIQDWAKQLGAKKETKSLHT